MTANSSANGFTLRTRRRQRITHQARRMEKKTKDNPKPLGTGLCHAATFCIPTAIVLTSLKTKGRIIGTPSHIGSNLKIETVDIDRTSDSNTIRGPQGWGCNIGSSLWNLSHRIARYATRPFCQIHRHESNLLTSERKEEELSGKTANHSNRIRTPTTAFHLKRLQVQISRATGFKRWGWISIRATVFRERWILRNRSLLTR